MTSNLEAVEHGMATDDTTDGPNSVAGYLGEVYAAAQQPFTIADQVGAVALSVGHSIPAELSGSH